MKVKHHFINNISISENYDVGRYVKEASSVIDNLHKQNKIPIVVGGSGLYINSLLYGIFEGPSADNQLRQELENRLQKEGIQSLLDELQKVDFETYQKIDKNNPRRIIRALEVFYLTGDPISQLQKSKHKAPNYINFIFGLKWDRNKLYRRINERAIDMVNKGLILEVKEILHNFGEDVNVVLQTVGYKEAIKYLKSEITLDEMIEEIKKNTRRYAKRQMTWFRKDKNINWIDVNDESEFEKIADYIIEKISGGINER